MTWIKTRPPTPEDQEIRAALERSRRGYPAEYGPDRQAQLQFPDAVREDSIVLSHSLIPGAMEHFFAGYAALLDPDLPLSRRQHEMIAATVSALNRCFY